MIPTKGTKGRLQALISQRSEWRVINFLKVTLCLVKTHLNYIQDDFQVMEKWICRQSFSLSFFFAFLSLRMYLQPAWNQTLVLGRKIPIATERYFKMSTSVFKCSCSFHAPLLPLEFGAPWPRKAIQVLSTTHNTQFTNSSKIIFKYHVF